jgi:putative oxidoreductase
VSTRVGESDHEKVFRFRLGCEESDFNSVGCGINLLDAGRPQIHRLSHGRSPFRQDWIPFPDFTTHFVGSFEVACGLLVLIGLYTRIASIPLLIVILMAIATTKIPELIRPDQGFWFMVSDARTDFAMTMSLLFLISVGAGGWSLDAWFWRRRAEVPQ